MLSKKKKIFVLVGMVALLVLTGCLNIFLNRDKEDGRKTGGEIQYGSFFEAYRATRLASRTESVSYLDEIIKSPASTTEQVADATDSKIRIANSIDTETTLEGLIKAMGFLDAVVTTSTENVNVIVKTDGLTSVQAAQILEVVVSETGKTANNVRIIPVE